MSYFVLLILAMPYLLVVAWVCFSGAFRLCRNVEKHAPPTRLDGYLPLRGRWLGYAVAGLLALLGMTALFLVGYALWSMLPRF
jgi:hypothetical protein